MLAVSFLTMRWPLAPTRDVQPCDPCSLPGRQGHPVVWPLVVAAARAHPWSPRWQRWPVPTPAASESGALLPERGDVEKETLWHSHPSPRVVALQSLSCVQLCDSMDCSTQVSLSFTIPQSLFELLSITSMMPSHHLILCCRLFLVPSIFPSIRVFSNEKATFTSGGQSIGASASVLPMNVQDWFPLGLIGFISLQSKGLLRILSNTTIQKHQFFGVQPSLWSNSYNPPVTTGKTIALTRRTCVGKVMPLLFNMLSRFVIAFLPRGKHLLISCLQSLYTVILEPNNIKSVIDSGWGVLGGGTHRLLQVFLCSVPRKLVTTLSSEAPRLPVCLGRSLHQWGRNVLFYSSLLGAQVLSPFLSFPVFLLWSYSVTWFSCFPPSILIWSWIVCLLLFF